jgi:hypothetical protein
LIEGIEKYNITGENIYNMDEKGFIIGLSNVVKRIMSLEALRSGRITNAQTDGNREFISLLAGICVDGTSIPPALVYKGTSHDLQSSWLDEMDDDTAYFAASTNGWSCDALGLQWLEKIFDRHTKAKAGRGRRLLIVDGHSSHINMRFLDTADRLRILVLILPSHSTHRLQPLDVGVFSALSTAYTNQLNSLQHQSVGLVSMTKRLFYPLFRDAFKAAFTTDRIKHAFEKPGIWPFNPAIVIDIIKKPIVIEPNIALGPRTPLTSRAVRRIHRQYKLDHSESKLELILRGHERLAAQHSIDNHIINGLREAFQIEKKKRQKSRRLNLIGKEDDGGPQFFSPSQVQAARKRLAEKDDEEAVERQLKAEEKARKALEKEQKEIEKKERTRKR